MTLRILSAPGAFAPQSSVLDAFHDLDGVFRLDLPNLNIGSRRHVQIAAAKILGEIGNGGELPVRQGAVGNAQPAHVRILRWRDIEQAIITPAEIVRRLGRFIALRLRDKARISVERMFLPLPFLLVAQLAAIVHDAVLRLEMNGVRASRLRAGAARTRRAKPGGEAFEVTLLVNCKIAGHGHAAFFTEARSPNINSSRKRPTSAPVRIRSR